MKRLYQISILAALLFIQFGCRGKATASIDHLPAFSLLLLDSSTVLKSKEIMPGKPLIFIYFQTDCPVCQQETKTLLRHIDSLTTVQLYCLTPMSLKDLKQYNSAYHLNSFKNITVATDYEHSFARIFRPRTVPYIAIYDNQKELVKIFSNETPYTEFLKALHL
jgi:peroxiredoxin